jgi:Spy/CpxP family protein refolding chaperone
MNKLNLEFTPRRSEMNRKRMGFTISFAVFFLAAVFAAGSVIAAGPGGHHGRFHHDPLFRLMHKLDLTDAQKTRVATILQSNEASAKIIASGLANARVQVARDTLSGNFNATDFNNLLNFEQQAVQLRASVVSSILPILTTDQQNTLKSIQDKIGTNIDEAINARFARLDKWIAKHSK